MTQPRGRRRRPRRVLVLGEDYTDSRAIAELIRAIVPNPDFDIRPLRTPQVLLKDAKPADVPDRVSRIAAVLRAEQTDADVVYVCAHEDCDAVEPAHEIVAQRIEGALQRLGVPVIAAAPAWELEAWWFLWPEAIKSYRSSWVLPAKYHGRRVGLIVDAKEELIRALRSGRGRDFATSDGVGIAAEVGRLQVVDSQSARSDSFDRFSAAIRDAVAAAS